MPVSIPRSQIEGRIFNASETAWRDNALMALIRSEADTNHNKTVDDQPGADELNTLLATYDKDHNLTLDEAELTTLINTFESKSNALFSNESGTLIYNNKMIAEARRELARGSSFGLGTSTIGYTATDHAGDVAATTQNRVFVDRTAKYKVLAGEDLHSFAMRIHKTWQPHLKMDVAAFEKAIQEANHLKPGEALSVGQTLALPAAVNSAGYDMAWAVLTTRLGAKVADALLTALIGAGVLTAILAAAGPFTGGATWAAIAPTIVASLAAVGIVMTGNQVIGLIDYLADARTGVLKPDQIQRQGINIDLGQLGVGVAATLVGGPTAVRQIGKLFKGTAVAGGGAMAPVVAEIEETAVQIAHRLARTSAGAVDDTGFTWREYNPASPENITKAQSLINRWLTEFSGHDLGQGFYANNKHKSTSDLIEYVDELIKVDGIDAQTLRGFAALFYERGIDAVKMIRGCFGEAGKAAPEILDTFAF